MSTVAILGATGTIGSELSRQLVECGRRVILLGRDETELQALSDELGQPWSRIEASDSKSISEPIIVEQNQGAQIGGIVNCIGSILLKSAHQTSDEEFRSVIETNLMTSFAAVKAGAQAMRGTGGGSIVLFASAAAEIGIANHEAIAAAKAGVIGLARAAAASYAPDNIRVNVISPGLTRTKLTERIWKNAASAEASTKLHALGRLGEPQQIVSLASWLLDPNNDWITGQVIGVDGGLGRILPRR